MATTSWSSIPLSLLFLTSTIVFCSGDTNLSCMKKLLPCEVSLKNMTMTPSSTCCLPLKETIESNPSCLCDALKNPAILKPYNITESQALSLPKRCNVKADLSVCNQTSTAPSTPPTPAPPHSGGSGISQGSGYIAAFAALCLAAF